MTRPTVGARAPSSTGRQSRHCGCPGCDGIAYALVRHPDHGERVVCRSHIAGMEVLEVFCDE